MEDDKRLKEKRVFVVRKRKASLNQPYLKGELGKEHLATIDRQIFMYKHFEPKFEAKAGDVYLARFPLEIGSEIHGDHFVAVILNSDEKNPMMTVVPLKSEKAKGINPASDIRLGKIKGINSGHNTVAIINQLRGIDKRRLLTNNSIDVISQIEKTQKLKPGEEINAQNTNVYRLSDEQLKILRQAVQSYLRKNYIHHQTELLVDF